MVWSFSPPPIRLGRTQHSVKATKVDWKTGCAVVIPALNEARAIGRVVSETRHYLPAVVVVDDGSSDDTAAMAAKAGAEIIRHACPQGKGAALQAGWEWSRARGFSWCLSMDGDGQHAPADIPVFLARAGSGSAALIVGNRMARPDAMPPVRRLVNRWMSRRLSRMAGQELPDSQCGFRLMNLGVWATLAIAAGHYEIESEVLLAFLRAGRRVEFVPVQVIYRSERSKIHPVVDTWRWFRWLARARQHPGAPRAVTRHELPG